LLLANTDHFIEAEFMSRFTQPLLDVVMEHIRLDTYNYTYISKYINDFSGVVFKFTYETPAV